MSLALTPEERDALTRRIAPDVTLGKNVRLHAFVNLYGCEIGDESTIGTGAIILPGVTVGEEAVVGAGAIVTQDVQDRSVVAGNPARVIRSVG